MKRNKWRLKNRIPDDKIVYYFAYGSNMFRRRLEYRVGPVKKIGVAKLDNYKLAFNCGNHNQSFVNITESINSKTVGIIYELTMRQIRILDKFEILYKRKRMDIKNHPCYVYISSLTREEFKKPVTIDYLSLIYRGYEENNIKWDVNVPENKLIRIY